MDEQKISKIFRNAKTSMEIEEIQAVYDSFFSDYETG